MSWLLDYFDAWSRHDAAGIMAHMCDDMQFLDTTLPHEVRGIENIAEFVRQSSEFVPDASLEIVTHFVTDDHFYAEWLWLPMNIPGVSVGRVRDGKVASQHDYWNKLLLKKWQAAQA